MPIINTMVPDRNISWAIRALSNNGPSVGKLITMETIMLPDTKVGKRYPNVLITGFKATQKYLKDNLALEGHEVAEFHGGMNKEEKEKHKQRPRDLTILLETQSYKMLMKYL